MNINEVEQTDPSNPSDRKLITTSDGSHTLYIPAMDEQYHSVNGAITESMHIFIEKGLKSIQKKEIRIFEVGFGTGLNAFLTWLKSREKGITVSYYTVEKYPLEEKLFASLNYPELLSPHDQTFFLELHTSPWEKDRLIGEHFTLHKIQSDINACPIPSAIDLVYFDAFAPNKQAGIWSQELFDKLYSQMTINGVLTTYCAKGIVRRMMQTSGFEVERIEGPPGKREMLRAIKRA